MKVRKGDTVLIIAGKDKGKTSQVQHVLRKENKILITGVNIQKHHLKPSKKNPHGGILDMPAPIDASNAMVVCPHCGKPSRVVYKISDTLKERLCRKCMGNLSATKAKETNVKA